MFFLKKQTVKNFYLILKQPNQTKVGLRNLKEHYLKWTAAILAENPKAKISTFIAIPYNPYEPKPYARWTIAGMLDIQNELKVAEEFWDFLSGKGTYNDLLDCFEQIGIELRSEIDDYFKKYNK
jgi:type II restriction enzyme